MNINFRHEAKCCLDRAKSLIAQDDESSIRYACLELRFAIEYLVYQHLEAYFEELGDEAMQKWTPKQVMQEMLAVDPQADQSAMIAIGIEETYGVPAENMSFIGEDRRFSLKWANSNHNALGNFLHAPTLYQLSSGNTPTKEKLRKKINDIFNTLKGIASSPFFNVNFGEFYTLKCECGRNIKRRSGSFKHEDGVKCPSCGTIWDIFSEDKGSIEAKVIFIPRKIDYDCFSCGQNNSIRANKFKEGEELTCRCGAKTVIRLTPQPAE